MRQFLPTAILFALALSACGGPSSAPERPNVLLIMGDDIGFSDIGPYGSEIHTPTLDRLANEGLRFSEFYNMAKCEPSRSTLFTGLYYSKRNAENARSMGGLMRDAGYYTIMAGKEHYDRWVPEHVYAKHNFDDSLVYWAINQYFTPPDGKWQNPYELNGVEIKTEDMPVANPPFYKADVLTDYALRFLDKARASGKPFFLYLPYNLAHYPLQAREEDIAKYRGSYLKGWDAVRQKRYERAKQMGVVPSDARLSPPEDNINKFRGPYRDDIYKYRPWESLSDQQKDQLDLEMAVFAAMVDRLDQNIGRVVAKLEQMGVLDNTLIMFLSDNGACPYDSNRDFSIPPGGPASYRTLSAAWANVGNTPYRYYKQYGHEGGPHTHFIARWPGVIKKGITDQPAHIADLLPTLLDVAGAEYPAEAGGKPTPTLDGHSLLPVFRGEQRPAPEILISGFTERFRMVRLGNWKMVRVNGDPWELYDLTRDPTELNNLAAPERGRLESMLKQYHRWIDDQQAVVPLVDQVK